MNRFSIAMTCVLAGHSAVAGLPRIFGTDPPPRAREKLHASISPTAPPAANRPSDPPPTPPSPAPTPPTAPFLTVDNYSVDVGEVAVIVPQTNCPEVKYFAIDKGLTVLPRKYLNTDTDMLAWGMTPGDFRMAAYSAMNGELTDPVVFTITVMGHAPQPPPGPQPVPPAPVPPVPPPPDPAPGIETAAQLWLVVVDDITRRQPATAAILADPIWFTFQSQGHKFRKYNITDPDAKNFQTQLTANGGQPVLVIMSAANNHWLNKDPADLKLPATPTGLQALVNKYTGK